MNKKMTIMNNVVSKETLRPIQQEVLDILSGILKQSFGPMGSNTILKKENALNVYTKDGHTILKNIYFHGIIEQSIKDDIESITRHIVTTVGDGTTSSVIMSSLIFSAISKIEAANPNVPPAEILKLFNQVVDEITEKIKASKKDCTIEDIYDIAMISTNGNEFISEILSNIYKDHGLEVFIDVAAATDEKSTIKTYDGMTLNTGFKDPCYITNPEKNEAVIDNPSIYFFKDPIDTKEMAMLFDAILSKNIVAPYNSMMGVEYSNSNSNTARSSDPMRPTVIVAPKISRDLSSLMKKITDLMTRMEPGERLPLLIITDYHQDYEVDDICIMCGGKFIHKYIDAAIMQQDIERGDCPTPDTIQDFCGYCDMVSSTSFKTSFVNPVDMKDENGEFTPTYKTLLSFIETELNRAREDGEDVRFIGTLKRRIHALKSNLVELSIGGITQADRDSLRDLVEDAVLNTRSAAVNGVGYGANYMGLNAAADISGKYIDEFNRAEKENRNISDIDKIKTDISVAIYGAYCSIFTDLYSSLGADVAKDAVIDALSNLCPMNIRTCEYDGKVKSSIQSDIIILETLNKIIGLMATCNQFVVPTPMHNVYVD